MAELNIGSSTDRSQRNAFDVAVDLVMLNRDRSAGHFDVKNIEQLFATYYAVAKVCELKSVEELQNLVPEEILDRIGKYSY
jgi:HD-GYP domain-containing protein (c-di-GMP phosphodiesterase class II)